MSVYWFLNETIENTNYLHRLAIYDSKFLDNIFAESFADFEAINEAIDFGKIKEKLSWKNIWEWIKGIFRKIGEGISKLAGRIKDFFTGKKKKEAEAKLKALEEEVSSLKMENLSLKKDKKELEKEIDNLTDKIDELDDEKDALKNKNWELRDKYTDVVIRKNDTERELIKKKKELDDAKNKEAYAKSEAESYKAKYKAVITAKATVLKEAADNLDLYFSVYDVMDPNYHPIRIIRSDWFSSFATFFEDGEEPRFGRTNANEDIVGYFDRFIEKNGDKLNIFNEHIAKVVKSDNNVQRNY